LNTEGWLRHIGDRQVRTDEQAADYLERTIIPSYRANGYGFWLMELRDSGLPVGMCGVYKRDYLELPDLGYALVPEHEGKGLATEAASAALGYAREQLGFSALCAIVTPDNLSSIRLLERLGFYFKHAIQEPAEKAMLSLYVSG